MHRLRQLSRQVFQVPPTTLYSTLHRLESAGLLAATRKTSGGRLAKFYRLTAAGRNRLGDDTGWQLLSDAVGQIAKLRYDMETAAAIQRALLPTTHRAGPFFDAGATAMPCWSIGGDFFDYMDLPGDALGFALGDVAGKGPPAALLAALVQGSRRKPEPSGDKRRRGSVGVTATSTRRHLEETLTVPQLGMTGTLERTLRTRNIIENLMGSVEGYSRRARRPDDSKRWVASALVEAEPRFRRVRGYRDLRCLAARWTGAGCPTTPTTRSQPSRRVG